MVDLFLLQTNGFFLTQTNGGKIIIGETGEEAGGSGGRSKQVGVSLVKKQLGEKQSETITNRMESKLLVQVKGFVAAPTPLRLPHMTHQTTSKIILQESIVVTSKIYHKGYWGERIRDNKAWGNTSQLVLTEICEMKAALKIDVEVPLKSPLIRVEMIDVYAIVPQIHPTTALMEYLKDAEQKKSVIKSKEDKKKQLKALLEILRHL